MVRRRRGVLSCAVALAALAAVFAGSSGTAFAKDCELGVSEQRSFGPDYVIGLRAKNVSCRKAKKVVRAYHQCRYEPPKPGLKGRCTNKVKRFSCNEEKRNDLPGAQYHTKVHCTRGAARITHIYQQSY